MEERYFKVNEKQHVQILIYIYWKRILQKRIYKCFLLSLVVLAARIKVLAVSLKPPTPQKVDILL